MLLDSILVSVVLGGKLAVAIFLVFLQLGPLSSLRADVVACLWTNAVLFPFTIIEIIVRRRGGPRPAFSSVNWRWFGSNMVIASVFALATLWLLAGTSPALLTRSVVLAGLCVGLDIALGTLCRYFFAGKIKLLRRDTPDVAELVKDWENVQSDELNRAWEKRIRFEKQKADEFEDGEAPSPLDISASYEDSDVLHIHPPQTPLGPPPRMERGKFGDAVFGLMKTGRSVPVSPISIIRHHSNPEPRSPTFMKRYVMPPSPRAVEMALAADPDILAVNHRIITQPSPSLANWKLAAPDLPKLPGNSPKRAESYERQRPVRRSIVPTVDRASSVPNSRESPTAIERGRNITPTRAKMDIPIQSEQEAQELEQTVAAVEANRKAGVALSVESERVHIGTGRTKNREKVDVTRQLRRRMQVLPNDLSP